MPVAPLPLFAETCIEKRAVVQLGQLVDNAEPLHFPRALLGHDAPATQGTAERAVQWLDRRRALVCLALFVVYLALLKPLGYHLTTPLFMFGCFYLLGTRRVVLAAVLAVGTSLLMSFVFEFWMSVIFPVGMFGIGF